MLKQKILLSKFAYFHFGRRFGYQKSSIKPWKNPKGVAGLISQVGQLRSLVFCHRFAVQRSAGMEERKYGKGTKKPLCPLVDFVVLMSIAFF
ncbi:MAG TPA: hypothetical protein PKA70_17290 [Saprospiraceae bacterium]|nr:hypothetical protein [Saprospiraceae bacterium]